MQISLNWLKQYVKLSKKITAEEIGRRLSLHTVEVEKIIKEGEKYQKVVVGKILEVRKHPNADRLQLADVKIGSGNILHIVCGAPNIQAGQLVPVALIGAIPPNGVEIKEAEVRGEKSQGMLCAPDELGLGDDHSGILILDKKAKIGEGLAEYLKLDDIIFEVDNKSLSNRPDLWCHYGLAREVATIFDAKLLPLKEVVKISRSDLDKSAGDIKEGLMEIKVKVEDDGLCPRYMAVGMNGIKVGESPDWLKKRLISAGMRPINNIVDITNFVMLELGQPLHAFDANKLREKENSNIFKIIVRRSGKDESIKTLDNEDRVLNEDMLLIASATEALAIAGVMGGASSEIEDETKEIIIEAANFNPVSIRKTSGRLSLRTESSMRFEKSLDPNLAESGLARAVQLVKEIMPGAQIKSSVADVKNFNLKLGPLEIDSHWLIRKIGNKIPTKDMIRILTNLGFSVEHHGHKLTVMIPTWRATKDIAIPEDIVEEIVRIYGYDNIVSSLPKLELAVPETNQERLLERKIKSILTGAPALTEVYNYSFVGDDQLKKLNIEVDTFIKIANPLASNQMLLRQSLMPNLVNNVRSNQAKFDSIGLFELGTVFMPAPGDIKKDSSQNEFLPYQEKRLGIVLAGGNENELFAQIKGIVGHLFENLGLESNYEVIDNVPAWADQKMAASIMADNKIIGRLAKLDAQVGRKNGLKKETMIAEINFHDLFILSQMQGGVNYREMEKYPPLVRDLAFVINAKILYNDFRRELINYNPIIKQVELFDVYEGDKVGRDHKSLAFHITYQADRTLTNAEVDELQAGLLKKLGEKFEAKLRDF